jgi:hypothetical protein
MFTRRTLTFSAALLAALAAASLASRAAAPQNPFAVTPGKEHELLSKLAGSWNAKFKLTMPGAPPMESKSTEVGEMLGGLWLISRYEDPNMMGERFSGVQLLGYDPAKKKYVSAWVDSQTAELSTQEGTWDEATKTLTLIGASKDPMTGQPSTSKSVVRWTDDEHRTSSLFAGGADGKEMELFRIEYERAK